MLGAPTPASRGSKPTDDIRSPGGVTRQPINHRKRGHPCAAMAFLCQTGPSRSVLVPISLATSSLLFLARGAPALVGLMYRGPTAHTAPLEQGERPQIFCSAHSARPSGVLPTPNSCFAEASPQLAPGTPAPAVTAGPVTEAFSSVPRAANGEH